MWVEFVVGSRPCPKGFSLVLRLSPPIQIPIRPGNSGKNSHSLDSTEIPIFFLIFVIKRELKKNLTALM